MHNRALVNYSGYIFVSGFLLRRGRKVNGISTKKVKKT